MPVVTQAEIAALGAALDVLSRRIGALTMPPVVPPIIPPAISEAANGTRIIPVSLIPIIDALGQKWVITAGKLVVDGVPVAETSGVVEALYFGHQVYQRNSTNNWYGPASKTTGGPQLAGDPSVVTPVTGGVPAPAAAVGFTAQKIGGPIKLGVNWTAIAGANISTNADGALVISGGGSTYNNQIGAVQIISGGFYAEATLSWTGVAVWTPGDGWPAFWSTNVAGGIGMINTEADFMEAMSGAAAYDVGLHNWNADGSDTNTGPGTVQVPTGTDFSKPHRYGFLYVPADTIAGYAKWYFDDRQIGKTIAIGQTGLYSSLATQPSTVLLGSGTKNPMTLLAASVWQKP